MPAKNSDMWRAATATWWDRQGIGPTPPSDSSSHLSSNPVPLFLSRWVAMFSPVTIISSFRFPIFSFLSFLPPSSQSLIPLDFYHRRRYISLSLSPSLTNVISNRGQRSPPPPPPPPPCRHAAIVSLMGSDSVGCISCCDELPLFMHLSLWNRKQVHPSIHLHPNISPPFLQHPMPG